MEAMISGSALGAVVAAGGYEPLFNESTLSSILWTAVTFGILAALLAVYAWPKILAALQEREKRIEENIASAEEMKQEAEDALGAYQKKLETARVDARAILDEGKADAEALKSRYLEEQHKEAEAIKKRAMREIALAKDKALEDLHKDTVEMAVAIASQLIEKNLKAADHKKLIEKAIAEAKEACEA